MTGEGGSSAERSVGDKTGADGVEVEGRTGTGADSGCREADRVMKVAFVGSHGVGKTTLCFELAAYLKKRDVRVDMVKEVARSCPLPINRNTTREAQAWILHTQIAAEIALSHKLDVLICDRSVLDNYAYLVHRMGIQPVLDDLVRMWVGTYDYLLKVPIVEPPHYDGVRDIGADFQSEIDLEVDRLLARFCVGCHRLEPDERDHWIEIVVRDTGLAMRPSQLGLFGMQGREGCPE